MQLVIDTSKSAPAAAEPPDGYMTVADVAELLKVHPETVRRLTRKRDLRGHSIGGQWRYLRSEVEEDVRNWREHRRAYYKGRRS